MSELKSGARLRAEAAKAIDAVVSEGRSLNAVLVETEERISTDDRALLRMLCYGTLRFHWRLRAQLRQLVERPLKARDSVIESLLAVGLFQLSDTRVPDHAAVSTTVEAARLLRRPKYKGLINAVLRNYLRQDMKKSEPTDEQSRFNHPAWLIKRLQTDWPKHWQQIAEANNDRAPMWLRVNNRHTGAAQYIEESAPGAQKLQGLEQAVRLRQPLPVEELPGFSEGRVSVQDAAAQLAAPWLLAGGGTRILDACAAPGGKTGHLLELMAPDAALTAIDQDAARLAGVAQNLARLKLDATVRVGDASNTKDWWDGRLFDRILLDAPCSATGVIRRHPDIKLLRREADIATLAALQRAMLEALWAVLRPSGRLLYVTCSVLAEENDALVGGFLAANDDAREDKALHNNNIHDLMYEKTCGFQVLPGTAGLDGFYFACLEKMS